MEKKIRDILETHFWLPTLKTREVYSRTHDDCDGDQSQQLSLIIDQEGDVHIFPNKSLRFRTGMGGGGSLRTRNALLILAEAIRLDHEDVPFR